VAKPEATFVRYINTRINTNIHVQSMYTPYTAGTPDCYYESRNMALWIEYKYEKQMPKIYRLSQKLSALQKCWLERAYNNGINVAVAVGFGRNEVVSFIDLAWDEEYTREELEPHIVTRTDFIKGIDDFMAGNSMVLGGML